MIENIGTSNQTSSYYEKQLMQIRLSELFTLLELRIKCTLNLLISIIVVI